MSRRRGLAAALLPLFTLGLGLTWGAGAQPAATQPPQEPAAATEPAPVGEEVVLEGLPPTPLTDLASSEERTGELPFADPKAA